MSGETPNTFDRFAIKWRKKREPTEAESKAARREEMYDHEWEGLPRLAQDDLYAIGRGLGTYAHDNDIAQMIFLDRKGRPIYIPVLEYWRATYPGKTRPGFYFLNPRGMLSKEKLAEQADPGSTWQAVHDLRQGISEDWYHENRSLDLKNAKSNEEIQDELRVAIAKGGIDTSSPTMVVDTCVHWRVSMSPVRDQLSTAGFTNLHVTAVSGGGNESGIELNYEVFNGTATRGCIPVGDDVSVRKSMSSVHSTRNTSNEKGERDAMVYLRQALHGMTRRQIFYRNAYNLS